MAYTVTYDGTDITEHVALSLTRITMSGRSVEVGAELTLRTKGTAVTFANEKEVVVLDGATPLVRGWISSVAREYADAVPLDGTEVWRLTISDVMRRAKASFLPSRPIVVRKVAETGKARLDWYLANYGGSIFDSNTSGVWTGGVTLVKTDMNQAFSGLSRWQAVNDILSLAGHSWWCGPDLRIRSYDAYNPPVATIELADAPGVSPHVGGSTVVPVARMEVASDTSQLVNHLEVVYRSGKRRFVLKDEDSIDEIGKRSGRLILLDVLTRAKARSLAKKHLATHRRAAITGSARIPYTAGLTPGRFVWIHQTEHGTLTKGFLLSVSIVWEDTADNTPAWLDLTFGDDPYDPPSLGAVVARNTSGNDGGPGYEPPQYRIPGGAIDLTDDEDPIDDTVTPTLPDPSAWGTLGTVYVCPITLVTGTGTTPTGMPSRMVPMKQTVTSGGTAVSFYAEGSGFYSGTYVPENPRYEGSGYLYSYLGHPYFVPETIGYYRPSSGVIAQENVGGGSSRVLVRASAPAGGKVVRAWVFLRARSLNTTPRRVTRVGAMPDPGCGAGWSRATTHPRDLWLRGGADTRMTGAFQFDLATPDTFVRFAFPVATVGVIDTTTNESSIGAWVGPTAAQNEAVVNQTADIAELDLGISSSFTRFAWNPASPTATLGFDPRSPGASDVTAYALIEVVDDTKPTTGEENTVTLAFEAGDTVVTSPAYAAGSERLVLNGTRLRADIDYTRTSTIVSGQTIYTGFDLTPIRPKGLIVIPSFPAQSDTLTLTYVPRNEGGDDEEAV